MDSTARVAASKQPSGYHPGKAREVSARRRTAVHRAETLGLAKLLLLGIRFTMQKNFYAGPGLDFGIEVITPSETDQTVVDEVIFSELVVGEIREESRARLVEVISSYEVSGVILGCTELPLLLSDQDCELPLLDTMDLHVRAALDYALAEDE